MSEGSLTDAAPLEGAGPLKGSASTRYRYGAFILLFIIILAAFFVKSFPQSKTGYRSGPSAAALPRDTDMSLTGLTSAGRFIMSGRIDINTTGMEGLALLPGIGRALAVRIIEQRAELGGFSSVDQLLGVEGIGPKKLASIKAFLRAEGRE